MVALLRKYFADISAANTYVIALLKSNVQYAVALLCVHGECAFALLSRMCMALLFNMYLHCYSDGT